jgi:hypothetical protein
MEKKPNPMSVVPVDTDVSRRGARSTIANRGSKPTPAALERLFRSMDLRLDAAHKRADALLKRQASRH